MGSALICVFGCGQKNKAADSLEADGIKTPATVAQAASVLDLSTIPLLDGAKGAWPRRVAGLSYAAPGDPKKALEFYRKKLLADGWKESNPSATAESASAMFARSGYVLSFSSYSDGKTGDVAVTLQNHGNVKFGKLPVPPGAKPIYVGDPTAIYATEATVPATAEACRALLIAQGWVPYGTAGDSVFYKQNAVLITATVQAAPAQGGKTAISYSGELLSADIPAPPDAENLRYTDDNLELNFESPTNKDAVVAFYRQTLAPTGWQATLDHTVDIDDKPTMIFRNPGKDMLTLSLSRDRRGKLPVSVQFQSAAEIAELDRKIKEQAPALRAAAEAARAKEAAREAERNKPLPKVAIAIPAGAKVLEETKDEIKFTVANGKAKSVVVGYQTQFREAGWKEDVASFDAMAGALSLSKEGQSLTITYSDTGFMPAEVSVSSMRAELERQ